MRSPGLANPLTPSGPDAGGALPGPLHPDLQGAGRSDHWTGR